MTRFRKFYAALTAGLLTTAAAIAVSPASGITSSELVTLAGVLFAAGTVWLASNDPAEAAD